MAKGCQGCRRRRYLFLSSMQYRNLHLRKVSAIRLASPGLGAGGHAVACRCLSLLVALNSAGLGPRGHATGNGTRAKGFVQLSSGLCCFCCFPASARAPVGICPDQIGDSQGCLMHTTCKRAARRRSRSVDDFPLLRWDNKNSHHQYLLPGYAPKVIGWYDELMNCRSAAF